MNSMAGIRRVRSFTPDQRILLVSIVGVVSIPEPAATPGEPLIFMSVEFD